MSAENQKLQLLKRVQIDLKNFSINVETHTHQIVNEEQFESVESQEKLREINYTPRRKFWLKNYKNLPPQDYEILEVYLLPRYDDNPVVWSPFSGQVLGEFTKNALLFDSEEDARNYKPKHFTY